MKREYRKPTIEVVDIETTDTCLKTVSWDVKGDNTNPDTDHGFINEDKGKDKYGKDEYDPWDPDKW